MNNKAILILEDGSIFEGISAGAPVTKIGELCFNTGMTGYQELFTDPSYYGQMLVMTSNHIGNYGIHELEQESNSPKIFGMICREFSDKSSRLSASEELSSFLMRNNIPAIEGIDTRFLVQYIRKHGSMNALISTDVDNIEVLKNQLAASPKMKGLELASKVSTENAYELGDAQAKFRIAVYDFGVKQNILNCFVERDCFLKVFNAKTPFEEIQKWNPDGLFLSNGPGDPQPMEYAIENVKKALAIDMPIFGICLGHQLLALSVGAKTYKLHNGHRGINHPVKNLINGKSEITSQNHGFGVDDESLKPLSHVEITHINLNDNTIEGIRIKDKRAFSVQYHPESSPGPHDSRYLFDDFLKMLK
jgi:carbamoyl-phosphate synthase small subunit